MIAAVYVTLYQISKFFVNILFLCYWPNVITGQVKWLRRLDLAREP